MIIIQPSYRSFAPPAQPLQSSYRGGARWAGDGDTISFTNADIGTPSVDRIVLVHVVTSSVDNTPTIVVNGQQLTHAVTGALGPFYGGAYAISAFYYALITTDASATITVSTPGYVMFHTSVDVYALYGLTQLTPVSTAFNNGGALLSLSATLTGVTAGDIIVAGAGSVSTSNAWSPLPLVEQYEAANEYYTTGAQGVATTNGDFTCTLTGNDTSSKMLAAVAWR